MVETQSNFMAQVGFTLVKVINPSYTPILLVKRLTDSKAYIFKVFPAGNTLHSYIHENQIHASLSHPNIISHIPTDHLFPLNQKYPYNLICMEYAPFGDFFNLILDFPLNDEKLIRTYFHQLIKGLKYIHSQHVAHLDLKLENLLLAEDFSFKIADFGLAQKMNTGTKRIVSGGTVNYRAPELLFEGCEDFCAADIYSAGVCLYVMMTCAFPFIEEREGQCVTLFRYDSFLENNSKFWDENQELVGNRIHLSESFKELINKMWARDPKERITLREVEMSKWYNESVYTEEELKMEMGKNRKL